MRGVGGGGGGGGAEELMEIGVRCGVVQAGDGDRGGCRCGADGG